MKTVYKVTFDLKIKGCWMASRKGNGWSSTNVLTPGDAEGACAIVRRRELAVTYDGKRPTDFHVLEVVRVVSEVIS